MQRWYIVDLEIHQNKNQNSFVYNPVFDQTQGKGQFPS